MTKQYPTLEGPTGGEYRQAATELFNDLLPYQVFTDDQRKQVNHRARELMLERQQLAHVVH